MRKLIFSLIAILALSVSYINAQEVKETVEPFDKGRRPAFSISLDYSKDIVEDALEERLKEDKLKGKSSSGFMEYIQVNYSTLCDFNCNFYTKVVGNSKSATIYLFISNEVQNFVSSGDDPETAENAEKFLKSVILDVQRYALKLEIEEQDKILEKAEKNYSKLIDEKEKLSREQTKVEKEIKESQKDVSVQKGILGKLKERQAKMK